MVGRVELIANDETTTTEIEARAFQLRERAQEALKLLPQVQSELIGTVQNITSPAMLADLVASFMDLQASERQDILETFDLQTRLDKVLELLRHRIEVLRLSREIGEKAKEQIDQRQREFILREQLRQIQEQLGEADEKTAEIAELAEAITKARMPEEVEKTARKELKRLERMPDASGEYSMVRTYLDWLIELPWQVESADAIDIAQARRILDEDHYGLEKVKRRILEFLAVHKLSPQGKSPILCFVGPPGVGKTSLGQSIARATGRKFVRASLGGVHDEAEIRGHRRTYIGALPGNIIQNIRKAGTRDCVFMLDEMDKLNASFQGDPSSALLEVLDPEQNGTFRDTYLAVPFDLSHVMFIGTANVLDAIPGPLRDRMEVIELPGYTEDEKLEIARRYLVRRQLTANGLTPEMGSISDDALRVVIRDYTREAGCRNLERAIGALFRRAAVRIAEGEATSVHIDVGRHRRHPGAAALRERSGAAHQRRRRRHRPRLDARRRRHPVHRGDPGAGQGSADPHRPARRRHEGERAGGPQPGQDQDGRARSRSGAVREERHPHPRPGRRHPQGRPKRRGGDVHRPCLAADRSGGARRPGDDRRDQPARPGAAGGRHQGEGGGGGAGRAAHGHAADAQQEGSRGRAGQRQGRARIPLDRARRRGGRDRSRPEADTPARSRRRPPRRLTARGAGAAGAQTLARRRLACGRKRSR